MTSPLLSNRGDRPETERLPVALSLAQAKKLHRHLLRPDGLEYQAYALARLESEPKPRYRVFEVLMPPATEYLEQGRAVVIISPWYILELLRRCCEAKPDLVLDLHSHPFADTSWFSDTEDRDYPKFADSVLFGVPTASAGRWVWIPKFRRARLEIGTPGSSRPADLALARFEVHSAVAGRKDSASGADCPASSPRRGGGRTDCPAPDPDSAGRAERTALAAELPSNEEDPAP